MKSLTRQITCLIACLLTTPLLMAQGTTCLCNGFNVARAGDWSFTNGEHFKRAVENLKGINGNFFGPSGAVNINVLVGSGIQFFSPIAEGADFFVTGLTSSSSYTQAERSAMMTAVQNGMNLVITGRDTLTDISDLFEVSLANDSPGDSLNQTNLPDHPIFAGPFGRITFFRGNSNAGHFNAWPEGTLLLASNSNGPTMLFIPSGIFGFGSVLLVSDIDTLTTNGKTLDRNSSSADVPVTDMLLMNIVAFLCSQNSPAVAPHMVFPQFANGDNNVSYLNLTNVDAQNQVTATVSLRDDNGDPFQVTILGMGSVSTFQVGNMEPNLTRTFATNALGNLKSGWASVRGSSQLSGNVIFFAPNLGATGVGAGEVAGGFVLPVVQHPILNTSSGVVEPRDVYNGLAVCNLSPVEADVRLELWDEVTGRRGDGVIFVPIPPYGHFSGFLFELYDLYGGGFDFTGFKGSLRVISTNTLISVAGLQLGESPGAFTTLPVAPIR